MNSHLKNFRNIDHPLSKILCSRISRFLKKKMKVNFCWKSKLKTYPFSKKIFYNLFSHFLQGKKIRIFFFRKFFILQAFKNLWKVLSCLKFKNIWLIPFLLWLNVLEKNLSPQISIKTLKINWSSLEFFNFSQWKKSRFDLYCRFVTSLGIHFKGFNVTKRRFCLISLCSFLRSEQWKPKKSLLLFENIQFFFRVK